MKATLFWVVMLSVFASAFPDRARASFDLVGNIEISTGNVIRPGNLALATLTITNNGPDVAQDVGFGTFYWATVGYRTIEVFAVPESAPCSVRYTDFTLPPPGISALSVDIRPFQDLGAGESLSCVVGLTTYPETPPVIRQRFVFGAIGSDPIGNGDFIFVNISTGTGIPAVSSLGLGLLALCMALIGMRLLSALTCNPASQPWHRAPLDLPRRRWTHCQGLIGVCLVLRLGRAGSSNEATCG